MNKNSGTFLAHDILNNPVILEWEAIDGRTIELSEKIKSVAQILVAAYTQTEVDFATKKPDDVASDFMLKSLAPLINHDPQKTDWQLFEQKTKAHLKEFFVTTDWAQYANASDRNLFVTINDQATHEQLGVLQFIISPEFPKNSIKAALSGVMPAAQERGLEKLLMSSIFKLCPDVERIFLHTRSSNERAIRQYKDWGFTEFAGKLPNWTDLEYLVKQSNTLQQIAQHLIVQN